MSKDGVPHRHDGLDDGVRYASDPDCMVLEFPRQAETAHGVVVVFGVEVRLGAPFDGDEDEGNGHDEA